MAKVVPGPNAPGAGPTLPSIAAEVLNAVIRSYPKKEMTIAPTQIMIRYKVINTERLNMSPFEMILSSILTGITAFGWISLYIS